ncbi:hypothetical protein [Caproicibacter sp.]|uniref:hypothetical protein n=1 Tax=Caproicibacter sp. TaxID=2814884 RepID=UPI00398941F1
MKNFHIRKRYLIVLLVALCVLSAAGLFVSYQRAPHSIVRIFYTKETTPMDYEIKDTIFDQKGTDFSNYLAGLKFVRCDDAFFNMNLDMNHHIEIAVEADPKNFLDDTPGKLKANYFVYEEPEDVIVFNGSDGTYANIAGEPAVLLRTKLSEGRQALGISSTP